MTPGTPVPSIAIIAALDRNGAIGRGGQLLWHEREDQKHFRAVTMGCPVIMGRKTWDSLPAKFKPLPGRRNIVVTRSPAWSGEGAEVAASLTAALTLSAGAGATKVFVIGGGELYAAALPLADELVLTRIDAAFDGADAFFPAIDPVDYFETAREAHTSAGGTAYTFVTFRRRG